MPNSKKVVILLAKIPTFTVTIRVPEHAFLKMEAEVKRRKERGEIVSKNSIYNEALELYLYYLETLEMEDDNEEEEV